MAIVPSQIYDAPSYESILAYYQGLRQFWHPVLPAEALPVDRPTAVKLLGEDIVLARLDGRVAAMQNLCRHFQARLSQGEIVEHQGEQGLMCSYHGWVYDAAGRCVLIPQLTPGREIPPGAKVPSYQVQTKYGLIWVCLAEEPKFNIPQFPEFDDPTFRKGPLRSYEPWQVSAPRLIMGTLDDTHFPWVHPGLLGDREHPEAPDHKVWREGQYLMSQYSILEPPNVTTSSSENKGEAGSQEELREVTYTNYVGMPNVIRLVKSGDYGTYVIWGAMLAHEYNLTTSYWIVARNYDLDPARDQSYEDFQDAVRAQDKPILEGQRPWLLPPFWTKIELPLRPADQPLIEYQKWLEELEIAVNI
ncbi:MAG TPA: aromatic ring-hydroxylating dioxygenase subunit alpha [Anaerolineae bacterium]|nr:aromatic ring-hydroxylating dioxygenase subunit alpha [Anaerolineae bacterium]